MLAGDLRLLTGDITPLELRAPSDPLESEYRIVKIESIHSTNQSRHEFALQRDSSSDAILLAGGTMDGGTVFFRDSLDPSASQFLSSGKLDLAPSSWDFITNDSSVNEQGFQGRLDFEYTVTSNGQSAARTRSIFVDPGISTSGDLAITNPAARLDVARIQQRLNLLDYRGIDGKSVVVDGLDSPSLRAAFRNFKASVVSSGELAAGAIAELDLYDVRTLRWLNSSNAPRWLTLNSFANNDRFTTSWVYDTVDSPAIVIEGVTTLQSICPPIPP